MARLAAALVLLLGALAAVAWAAVGDTSLVSRASGPSGAKGSSTSNQPDASADGRVIAFASSATNLDPADTDELIDVFARNTASGVTLLVSRADGPSGEAATGVSLQPSVSADGRYVAFETSAANLDPQDPGDDFDVYVRDMVDGTTRLVSRASGPAGAPGDGESRAPSISADGRYVAFQSLADNLGGGGVELTDVFVRDLVEGTTTHVSRTNIPTDPNPNSNSVEPSISGDGTRVTFTTDATNLEQGGFDELSDVFVRDLVAGQTSLVSRASGADGANSDGSSSGGRISLDGGSVAFSASASNLGGPESFSTYVRDLDAATTTLVSRATGANGAPANFPVLGHSISGDGRLVAFATGAFNLDPDDPDEIDDVYVRDVVAATTTLASRASGAAGAKGDGTSNGPAIAAGGAWLAFVSDSTNLTPDDTDRTFDVFVRQLAEVPVEQPPPPPPGPPPPGPPPPPPIIVDPPPTGQQPVAGRSEFVQVVRGRVRVRVRGKKRFVRLRAGRLLRDGSEIDTTRGVARIVVAARRDGSQTAFALVSRGRAIIDQNRARRPVTTLKLSERLTCANSSNASSSQRKKKRKRKRSLFTDTNGRFRTRGGFGSAAASGTQWLTTDRCTSTRIGVFEGTVRVRDFARKRTRTLRAGDRYTAFKRANG